MGLISQKHRISVKGHYSLARLRELFTKRLHGFDWIGSLLSVGALACLRQAFVWAPFSLRSLLSF